MNIFGLLQIFLILMSTIVIIKAQHNIFCYYHMSTKSNEFNFNDLDPKLCSHLVYDDFKIDDKTGSFITSQPELLLDGIGGNHILRKLSILKLKYTNLKLLALIGPLDSYETLSNMIDDPKKRENFIETTIEFLETNEFDGIDFRFNVKNDNDKNNHAILAKELNEKFSKHNKILVLCIDSLPNLMDLSNLYNIQDIAKYANFLILRTFEMNRNFSKVGFDSALFPSHEDDSINIKSLVEFWLNQEVPAEKLIIYISTIGRKYILADGNNSLVETYPGAPADIKIKPQSNIYYNKYCYELKNDTAWVERWDNKQKSPYAYKSNIWINYDNIQSVKLKTEFVTNMKLGGLSFGPLQYDDYKNICNNGTYPLLNTIYTNLKEFMDEYKYIVNVKVIKRHIRSGETEQIYNNEENFGLEEELFSTII